MRYTPNPKRIKEFKDLIDAKKPDENAIQRFLEKNTAFLETPHLLQGVFLNCVVTKINVGPWKTDFLYLSKHSRAWNIVLLELKLPNRKIFQDDSEHLAFSADFNNAIAQIGSWRDQWDTDSGSLIEKLKPLLLPPRFRSHIKYPKFVLVIGRDKELAGDEARMRRLETYSQKLDLRVMTYDTLLRTYKEGRGQRKCVLSPTARGFKIKVVDGEPEHIFAHNNARVLKVSPEVGAKLEKMGFNIRAWRNGELLTFNWKRTEREAEELDSDEAFIKRMRKVRLDQIARKRAAGKSGPAKLRR